MLGVRVARREERPCTPPQERVREHQQPSKVENTDVLTPGQKNDVYPVASEKEGPCRCKGWHTDRGVSSSTELESEVRRFCLSILHCIRALTVGWFKRDIVLT